MAISEKSPITENFSEIKRMVGRPKKWTMGERYTNLLPENWNAICRRSQINEELRMRTLGALGFQNPAHPMKFDPEYEFLFPFKGGHIKYGGNTVLYALGRIDDDDLIRALATKICENKLTAKQAREYIKLVLSKLKGQEGEHND